jgi:hypothetical protein
MLSRNEIASRYSAVKQLRGEMYFLLASNDVASANSLLWARVECTYNPSTTQP